MHAVAATGSERSATRPKARRTLRACDFCHSRSIRCRASGTDPSRCQSCVDYDERCTSNRPLKKRGVRPRVEQDQNGDSRSPASPEAHSPTSWQASAIASQALIMDLVEVYFEVVYPIFPFFHQPTVTRRVARGEYQTNRALFAATMAICALASARARDGAIFSGRWDLSSFREPSSEAFFAAAETAIPKGNEGTRDFNYMRACALLSITAIQYGQARTMRYYQGLYNTYVETDSLHDEANWPRGIGTIEREERRRLFWSIYTLDVYTSVVWGSVVRSREAQSNVLYPTATDDTDITDAGYRRASHKSTSTMRSSGDDDQWLHGWNVTTDLYRILEHVLEQFRRRRRPEHRLGTPIDALFGANSVPNSAVLDMVLNMYKALPSRFKETPTTSEDAQHRLNFQTANIAATIQLVRMILFAAEDATVEQRCRVASELLQAFSDIPVIYLRAISSPLLHHLAGIGSILGSVFENGLPESSYQQIRAVLLSMVRLLADLEAGLSYAAGASLRIQTLVERIDNYIRTKRQIEHVSHVHSQGDSSVDGGFSAADSYTPSVTPYIDASSPVFSLSSELLDDWSWAFDFAQPGLGGDGGWRQNDL